MENNTVLIAATAAVTAAVITGTIAFIAGAKMGQDHIIRIVQKNLITVMCEETSETK